MTQIDVREIAAAISPRATPDVRAPSVVSWFDTVILLVVFLAGIALGRLLKKGRNRDA
jgi:hypothetical protein